MNRQDRRRNKLRTSEPTYNLKYSQILGLQKQTVDKIRSQAVDDAFILMLAIPLKILKDKFDWTPEAGLEEFAEYVTDEYQDFVESATSLEDYAKLVYDECGFTFVMNS